MDAIKAKLAVWSKDRALMRGLSSLGAAVLVLIVILCISIYMRANIQNEYSEFLSGLQERTYQSMQQMTELFSRVDDPNVDVRYKLIPELKAQYSAAAALNTALREDCGEKCAVMSLELTAAIDKAFEEYAQAYRQGIATGLAKADMAACIQEMQLLLEKHYSPPKEEDEVVVINAASGEAVIG